MQLYCVDCGAAIPAGDINLESGLAKCAVCNSVFSFKERFAEKPPQPAVVGIVPKPAGMNVENLGGVRRITWRWFNYMHVFLLFFCIFWDGFLVVWYSHDLPVAARLFPLLHVCVGIGLTYYVITGFVNRTIVDVGDFTLSVWHGPLPWRGNQNLPAGQIKQIYCERVWSQQRNSMGPQYAVSAVMANGNKIRLVRGLNELGDAKFLEQQIEARLKIRPEPVAGECNG